MIKIKSLIAILILLINIVPAVAQNSGDITRDATAQMQNEPQNYISKSQYPISIINPTPANNPIGAYYPGVRGGNQLIIYTPQYGNRTETNEFGSEAVIENNIVVELSGSNSSIPANGFVISGHGNAQKWINKNITEGAVIRINPEQKIIESYIVPESYTYKASQKIDNVQKALFDYKLSLPKKYQAKAAEVYLYKAMNKLDEAKSFQEKQDYNRVKTLSSQAEEFADLALYNTVPAKKGEFHGIWLRPVEKNQTEIINTLEKLKNAGIDNVFVETYYHGYTIFPSKTLDKYGVLSQKKEFQGWDPLKAWIEEAHKRDMKIHVWFQTFYAGNEDISKNPKNVVSAHPDWANFQKRNYAAQKPMPSISEHNGYFLDPANPEVQKYLSELITEIVNTYSIDGLNIDYIRYPASLSRTFPNYLESTWGYTDYARKDFKSLYGIDPVCLTLNDPLWQKWIEYRQNKVTNFVSKLKPIVKNKNVTISTVIFPDAEESRITKLQNWKVWGNNCLVDAFTPLVMGSDEYLAENYVKQIKDNVANSNTLVYPGLFEPFVAGSPADLLYQIKAARKSGAAGIMIFDNAHLSKEFITALKARVFTNK